ncbi:hypothetical protein MATL_G00100470 [Megalops atlanticus]|uniref:Integrase catalytic domain-containing protein n=1 Tax=Megalops atlanticus TaxID=7932 RepID=A0A9D3Q504_MEGAT|nr:hypothetical protein MATL_G00100470 [Megalops atlanticus]
MCQSNGLVERFNRTLATQLAILTSRRQQDWDLHLPLVLWAYRTAVQESTRTGKDFAPGALVWVYSPEWRKGLSPKLTNQWIGLCTVLSDVVYRVRLVRRNRVVVLHCDQLAPYQPLAPSGGDSGAESQPTTSAMPPGGAEGLLQQPPHQPTMSVAPPGDAKEPRQRPSHQRRLPQCLRDFDIGRWGQQPY